MVPQSNGIDMLTNADLAYSRSPLEKKAAVAQLVEHVIRNDGVGGSSPLSGTITIRKSIISLGF